MRLISQGGMIDVPYEQAIIEYEACERNGEDVFYIIFAKTTRNTFSIAKYSTESKALKVMDMLREQYEYGKKISVPQLEESGIAEDDDVMLFNTRLINDYFKGGTYLPVKLFKFPDDSEVEV